MTTLSAGFAITSFPKQEKHTRAGIEAMSELFLVLDEDLRVVVASRSYYAVFKKVKAETEGTLLYTMCIGHYDVPALKYFLHMVIEKDEPLKNYKLVYDCKKNDRKLLLLSAQKTRYENSKADYILLTITDMTPLSESATAL